jgi:hypothetical protein
MRGLLDCTAFALLAGHSFFKLRTIPRPRAGDGISVPLRGGTPMRTWTRLTLAALLALPFTLAPLLAADPEETTEQKVKRLEKELAQLRKDLEDLREKQTNNSLRRNAASEDLRNLRERLGVLEQIVVKHDDLLKTPITRQSGYLNPGTNPQGTPPPGTGNGGTAAPAMGTVTVRNLYPASATVVVNGTSIPLQPNQAATIKVPLGQFTYEVFVDGFCLVQAMKPETLTAQGRTITIHPRTP